MSALGQKQASMPQCKSPLYSQKADIGPASLGNRLSMKFTSAGQSHALSAREAE